MDQQNHNFSKPCYPYFVMGLQCKMDSGYRATKPQPKLIICAENNYNHFHMQILVNHNKL